MKLRVLGANGGELVSHFSTCFILDDTFAIDAGALTSRLTLAQLERIEHVLLTHSHFDHVKDLPMVSDLFAVRPGLSLKVHANRLCIRALKRHVFNDVMWPDFTTIPHAKKPVVDLRPFALESQFRIGPYQVRSIPVDHPVPCSGFLIASGNASIGISGDTGPTRRIWKVFRAARNLKAILVECSFPNELQHLADVSGHLTPQSLLVELEKLGPCPARILLYHLKPAFEAQIREQVRNFPVEVVSTDDVFEW